MIVSFSFKFFIVEILLEEKKKFKLIIVVNTIVYYDVCFLIDKDQRFFDHSACPIVERWIETYYIPIWCHNINLKAVSTLILEQITWYTFLYLNIFYSCLNAFGKWFVQFICWEVTHIIYHFFSSEIYEHTTWRKGIQNL